MQSPSQNLFPTLSSKVLPEGSYRSIQEDIFKCEDTISIYEYNIKELTEVCKNLIDPKNKNVIKIDKIESLPDAYTLLRHLKMLKHFKPDLDIPLIDELSNYLKSVNKWQQKSYFM